MTILTAEKKETILRLKALDKPWQTIADAVGAKVATVRTFHKRWMAVMDLPPKVKLSKRKINGHVGLEIKRLVRTEPRISIRKIQAALEKKFDNPPGRSTIQTFLRAHDFVIEKLKKRPLLRAANVEKRMSFACENVGKDPGVFDNILWSDEVRVQAYPNHRIIIAWRREDLEHVPELINPQVQGGGISVTFWGCFSASGTGPLVPLDGMMNSQRYMGILHDYVKPEIDARGGRCVFMQDNASTHKSRIVMECIRNLGIRVLEWPPQSPDLNPIEHLWAILKHKLYTANHSFASKADLISKVLEIWALFPTELCKRLSSSVPGRLERVIERDGRTI